MAGYDLSTAGAAPPAVARGVTADRDGDGDDDGEEGIGGAGALGPAGASALLHPETAAAGGGDGGSGRNSRSGGPRAAGVTAASSRTGGKTQAPGADADAAAAAAAAASGSFGARRSALYATVSFLTALTNPSADGRIIITTATSSSSSLHSASSSASASSPCLRYTTLNAAGQFAGILRAARSVVLASGTLSPVGGLLAQLMPHVDPGRVRHFSCGHVVPRDNLVALAVGSGPTGQAVDLRHERRTDARVLEEVGAVEDALTGLCVCY